MLFCRQREQNTFECSLFCSFYILIQRFVCNWFYDCILLLLLYKYVSIEDAGSGGIMVGVVWFKWTPSDGWFGRIGRWILEPLSWFKFCTPSPLVVVCTNAELPAGLGLVCYCPSVLARTKGTHIVIVFGWSQNEAIRRIFEHSLDCIPKRDLWHWGFTFWRNCFQSTHLHSWKWLNNVGYDCFGWVT